ncbi:MAG: YIP1 family protein [Dehalococcoidia bacterium]
MDFARTVNWLGRVIRLDSTAFDEIKLDPSGMIGGLIAVVLTNLVIGIGTYIYGTVEDLPEKGDLLIKTVILGTIVQTVLWVAWPGVTYLLLNSFYKATADVQQLIATMGFAYVPAAIMALIFITPLDTPFALLGMVAAFVLTQYAIASSSNASSVQITLANLAGLAAFSVLMSVIAVEILGDDGLGDYPFASGIWFLDWLGGLLT